MDRVMIFIDGSNLYHGLEEYIGRHRMHYDCFCNLLCREAEHLLDGENKRLVHTHYYNVPLRQHDDPKQYAAQRKFFANLEAIPHLTLHRGRLVDRDRENSCPECGHKYVQPYRIEKGVDVQLASHLLVHAFDNQYDTAILVSRDGDFAPVVHEVLRLGKTVINADFPLLDDRGRPTNQRTFLSQSCDGAIILTRELLAPCLF